jgi:hypothetical protein
MDLHHGTSPAADAVLVAAGTPRRPAHKPAPSNASAYVARNEPRLPLCVQCCMLFTVASYACIHGIHGVHLVRAVTQIGNAVAPPMAAALGRCLLLAAAKKTPVAEPVIPVSRACTVCTAGPA